LAKMKPPPETRSVFKTSAWASIIKSSIIDTYKTVFRGRGRDDDDGYGYNASIVPCTCTVPGHYTHGTVFMER
jgi:hypothetical protein